jgi:hypothetical protein
MPRTGIVVINVMAVVAISLLSVFARHSQLFVWSLLRTILFRQLHFFVRYQLSSEHRSRVCHCLPVIIFHEFHRLLFTFVS